MKATRNQQSGFTLIEVLVAGFILFLVISAATLVYRGATLSSQKAESSLYINGMLPLVVDKVQAVIRTEGQGNIVELSGQGEMADVSYVWSATVTEYRAAPPQILPESTIVSPPSNRFKLWQLNLNLTYRQHERQFRYLEFSWDETSIR